MTDIEIFVIADKHGRTDDDNPFLTDPAGVTFRTPGTPMLVWERHAEHGVGWVLWYLESDDPSAGAADYFVGGSFDDSAWALASARAWLERLAAE